jgi:hypothetical protein
MLTEYSTLGPKSASMGLPGVYRIRDAHRLTHGTVAGLQRIVRRLDFQGCIKIDEEESQTKFEGCDCALQLCSATYDTDP